MSRGRCRRRIVLIDVSIIERGKILYKKYILDCISLSDARVVFRVMKSKFAIKTNNIYYGYRMYGIFFEIKRKTDRTYITLAIFSSEI